MAGFRILKPIIQKCLNPIPHDRWDANMILAFGQLEFAKDIQRLWRGYVARRNFKLMRRGIVKLQSAIKGYVTRRKYQHHKKYAQEEAALAIQRVFRGFQQRIIFRRQKAAIMKC